MEDWHHIVIQTLPYILPSIPKIVCPAHEYVGYEQCRCVPCSHKLGTVAWPTDMALKQAKAQGIRPLNQASVTDGTEEVLFLSLPATSEQDYYMTHNLKHTDS
jgi:hypothetical protein